jgi:hypothetical protein
MTVGMEPQNQRFVTVLAAVDLTNKKYHFIDAGGALSVASDTDTIGILWVEGESGEPVTVCTSGYCPVRCPAGSKLALGDIVEPDANAQAVATTTADDIGYKCVKAAATNGGLGIINLDALLRVHA